MKNYLYCSLLYKLRKQESISPSLLKQYIEGEEHPAILIADLFTNVPIKAPSYLQLRNYIQSIVWPFCAENKYNVSEQEWYIFYLIQCSYRNPQINTQTVIDNYNKLPYLVTQRTDLQWIAYRVKSNMLFYYITLEKDYSKIQKEISLIPDNIKNLHY